MRQIKPIFPKNNPSRVDIIKNLINEPDFKIEVGKIRSKWKIDTKREIEMYEADWTSEFQEELLNDLKFRKDLLKLQKKFNLGKQWVCFIREYIFNDLIECTRTSNYFIEKRTGKEGDSITGEPAYYLRIFPETTQDDIMKSWKDINRFIHESEKKPKRQKNSKNSKRDERIMQLANSGLNVKDIQASIKKEFGKFVDYNAVVTVKSRQKRKHINP